MKEQPKVVFSKICVDDYQGAWYAIGTERGWLEIRVTPSGYVRIGEFTKDKHPYFTPTKRERQMKNKCFHGINYDQPCAECGREEEHGVEIPLEVSPLAIKSGDTVQNKGGKMKVYLASSWRNEHQPHVVKLLRSWGYKVYDFRNPDSGNTGFHWSEIDPKWEGWTTEQLVEALNHPLAKAGFKSDWEGMLWAGVCVLLLPCGRSAHLEAGQFVGADKPVIVYSPEVCEPELMYRMTDGIAADEAGLKLCLSRIMERGTK